jgi:hypothetical protein
MKEEEEDKIWSRVPKGGPISRLTGRLTVGRKKNSNSKHESIIGRAPDSTDLEKRKQFQKMESTM